MSHAEEALAALGLALPEVSTPVAAYAPAVVSGNQVWVSGQLPFVDGALPATGAVGADVEPQQAHELAGRCALNALAALKSVVGDLDRVERIVKLQGFVASDPSFTGQPAVIDGASALLRDVFGDRGVHARSAVGVAVLPLGSPVEVDLVVTVTA